ncbi:MAG: hypothetical protein QOD51_2758, partial [Candidatus Eremiobacteraeota bacterium]|nr:hypothetical protein [Candidatus Eremiobacteraeota bacterium]
HRDGEHDGARDERREFEARRASEAWRRRRLGVARVHDGMYARAADSPVYRPGKRPARALRNLTLT